MQLHTQTSQVRTHCRVQALGFCGLGLKGMATHGGLALAEDESAGFL